LKSRSIFEKYNVYLRPLELKKASEKNLSVWVHFDHFLQDEGLFVLKNSFR
jgi:hypothetical protein